MFEVELFIDKCKRAVMQSEPWFAVRDLLREALLEPRAVLEALPVTKAELQPLYLGDDVTVVKVVWAPAMRFPPHDHLTWACNGIYLGAETNQMYRIRDGRLVETEILNLVQGDVGLLMPDAIHAVRNPRADTYSAAIHVYGGGFAKLPRSNWVGNPPAQRPASLEETQKRFDEANGARVI